MAYESAQTTNIDPYGRGARNLNNNYQGFERFVAEDNATSLTSGRVPPGQRKRIAVACSRCRKRKIKCTGEERPGMGCDNCKACHQEATCKFLRVAALDHHLGPSTPNVMIPHSYRFSPYGHSMVSSYSPYSASQIPHVYDGYHSNLQYHHAEIDPGIARESLTSTPGYPYDGEHGSRYSTSTPSCLLPTFHTDSSSMISGQSGSTQSTRTWHPSSSARPGQGLAINTDRTTTLRDAHSHGQQSPLVESPGQTQNVSAPSGQNTLRTLPALTPVRGWPNQASTAGAPFDLDLPPVSGHRTSIPWITGHDNVATTAGAGGSAGTFQYSARNTSSHQVLDYATTAHAHTEGAPQSEGTSSAFDGSQDSRYHYSVGTMRTPSCGSPASGESKHDSRYAHNPDTASRGSETEDGSTTLLSDGTEYTRVPPYEPQVMPWSSSHQSSALEYRQHASPAIAAVETHRSVH